MVWKWCAAWRGYGGIFHPRLSVVTSIPFSSTKHRAIDLQAQLHMEEPIKVKTLQSRLQNAHFVLTIVLLEQFASSRTDIAICFVKGELM